MSKRQVLTILFCSIFYHIHPSICLIRSCESFASLSDLVQFLTRRTTIKTYVQTEWLTLL